jgi:hypothetical protein
LPTGGGFVFNFRALPISAGIGDFSLSSRETTELELEPHSLLSLEQALIAAISLYAPRGYSRLSSVYASVMPAP